MKEKRPIRADAEKNRRHILDVAQQAFADEGIAVSVDEIARRSGLGVGTLYRHFPTKEALFEAIVVDRIERVAEQARAFSEADDAGTALFEFLAHLVEEGTRKRDLVDAIGGLSFASGPTTEKGRADFRRALTKLLTRAQRGGSVRRDVDTADLIAFVKGLISIHETSARVRARHVAILCDGLRARK